MAITTHNCFAVRCDVCKDWYEGSFDGIAHFDTQEEALDAASDSEWHVASDGGAAVCSQDDAAHWEAIRAQHAAGIEDGHWCWLMAADEDEAVQPEEPRP